MAQQTVREKRFAQSSVIPGLAKREPGTQGECRTFCPGFRIDAAHRPE
jgi:hypothetical protein